MSISKRGLGTHAAQVPALEQEPLVCRSLALSSSSSHGKKRKRLAGNPERTLSLRAPHTNSPSPTQGASQRKNVLTPLPGAHLEAAFPAACIYCNCPLTLSVAQSCV